MPQSREDLDGRDQLYPRECESPSLSGRSSDRQRTNRALLRRRLLRVAGLGGAFAASAVFGYLAVRGVMFNAAWRAIRACNYWWLVPSLATLAAWVGLRVIRWQILFDPKRRPPFGTLAKTTVIGFFFNTILPARAGDAVRIAAQKHYAGTSLAEATATVVVERILDVATLIVLVFALAAWLPSGSWLEPAAALAFFCLLAIAVLGLFVRRASQGPTASWLRWLSRLPGVHEEMIVHAIANLVHGLATLRRPQQAILAVAWTFLSWFVLGLSYWFLMIGFHLGLSPLAGLLVAIVTSLAFIIPAAPAAVGVFEAAALAVTSAYGASRSQSLAYVLVLHLVSVVPFLLAGALLLGQEARVRGATRRAAAERLRSGD
jgi:glycosyltransferase 2 family protein